jgi:hypothetical protein
MTTATAKAAEPRRWRRLQLVAASLGVFVLIGFVYVRAHPLVFNESFFGHAHCMPQASGALTQYALDHAGRFPEHTNGYGDALLMLSIDDPTVWSVLTGPGYDSDAYKKWLGKDVDVPESECGRVYLQGLSMYSNPEIAILFDKLPSPGDHCHFFKRLWAAPQRDVCLVSGWQQIKESEWPEFARKQIELLVKEGFDRAKAEALYAEQGKGC